MTARRTTLTPEAGAGLAAALAVLVIVSGIQLSRVDDPSVVGWLAIAPFLAAAFAPWRWVVLIGALASAMCLVSGFLQGNILDRDAIIRMVGMALATASACAVAIVRQNQNRRFAELSRLATVAS